MSCPLIIVSVTIMCAVARPGPIPVMRMPRWREALSAAYMASAERCATTWESVAITERFLSHSGCSRPTIRSIMARGTVPRTGRRQAEDRPSEGVHRDDPTDDAGDRRRGVQPPLRDTGAGARGDPRAGLLEPVPRVPQPSGIRRDRQR